jgi:hypothetical protein
MIKEDQSKVIVRLKEVLKNLINLEQEVNLDKAIITKEQDYKDKVKIIKNPLSVM